jgi:HK97 gp10 family phage protein
MPSEVKGGKELARVLKLLPKEIGAKVLSSALMTSSNVIAKEIKARAPVREGGLKSFGGGRKSAARRRAGEGRLGGFLKSQVKRRRLQRATNKQAAVGITLGTAFYWKWLEFGNSRQPARPFVRPAFDDSVRPAIRTLTEDLAKKIEKAAVKLAGKFKTSGLATKRRRR